MAMKQISSTIMPPNVSIAKVRQRLYEENREYVLKMQPIAISQFYTTVWPKHEVIELDNDKANNLKAMLDVGGADKMLRAPNGSIAFLGQRFRRYRSWHPEPKKVVYDDFTLRCSLPNGNDSEMERLRQAMERGGFVATWYAYGHANPRDTGFCKFRIIRLPLLLACIESGQITPKWGINPDGRPFACIPFQTVPPLVFLLAHPGGQLPIFSEVT